MGDPNIGVMSWSALASPLYPLLETAIYTHHYYQPLCAKTIVRFLLTVVRERNPVRAANRSILTQETEIELVRARVEVGRKGERGFALKTVYNE